MRTICLPGVSLSCSRFIFGCASLFRVGTEKRRLALLETAVDSGFSHFDTAPYYGFGTAERDLAHILKRHHHITLTTKVGIYSPGGENQSFGEIFLRKAGGRFLPRLSRPTICFDLARARKSLESSVSRLGRDHIDLFVLHEPRIELLATDEWRRWFESLKLSGIIGEFGIAAAADLVQGFLEKAPELTPVVQTVDSLDRKEADVLTVYGRPLQITYGYVSAARKRGDARSASEILHAALKRNPKGAVIVSTRRVEHLPQYRAILEANAHNANA
jgi:aryl-alcohol dehydrogenase-like predicted oxidoreductase